MRGTNVMATFPISLFFRDNRKYGIGSIEFDLILSETHNYNSTITEHPVEDGSVISDHIDNALESGSINGLITNYSLRQGEVTTNRAQDVFEALVALWEERTLVTITTVLKVYEDVTIMSMPFTREAAQGESLPISITFKKMKIVKLQSVILDLQISVPDLDTEQNKQVAIEQNVGETVADSDATVSEAIFSGNDIYRQRLIRGL